MGIRGIGGCDKKQPFFLFGAVFGKGGACGAW